MEPLADLIACFQQNKTKQNAVCTDKTNKAKFLLRACVKFNSNKGNLLSHEVMTKYLPLKQHHTFTYIDGNMHFKHIFIKIVEPSISTDESSISEVKETASSQPHLFISSMYIHT
jgi:hypothetical protein